MQALADEAADHFERHLTQATKEYDMIIAVTHIPPFREAAWHRDKYSADDRLPFFAPAPVRVGAHLRLKYVIILIFEFAHIHRGAPSKRQQPRFGLGAWVIATDAGKRLCFVRSVARRRHAQTRPACVLRAEIISTDISNLHRRTKSENVGSMRQ